MLSKGTKSKEALKHNKMCFFHPLPPDNLLPSLKGSRCFVFIFLGRCSEIGGPDTLSGLETLPPREPGDDPHTVTGCGTEEQC